MISTRSVGLVIDTFVCLTLAKWETVSGHFGGYLSPPVALTRGFFFYKSADTVLIPRPLS
jgi:hypothetical protein